jgi:hypothetical protein
VRRIAARTTVVGVHIDALARRARPLPPDVRDRAIHLMREDDVLDQLDQRVEDPLLEPTR